MRQVSTFALPAILLFIWLACDSSPNLQDNPKALVERMVAEVGGIERLNSLKDVEYTYTLILLY